jgi:hypothetical protein
MHKTIQTRSNGTSNIQTELVHSIPYQNNSKNPQIIYTKTGHIQGMACQILAQLDKGNHVNENQQKQTQLYEPNHNINTCIHFKNSQVNENSKEMTGTKSIMFYHVSITSKPNFMFIQYHMSISHKIYQPMSHKLAQLTNRDEK